MRDTLFEADYFDEFIAEELARIERFQTRLNSGTVKEDRVPAIKDKLLSIRLGVLIAKYSRGDSLNDLKKEFELIIMDLTDTWCADSYYENLRIASLAVLFNVNSEMKKLVKNVLEASEMRDCLIDFLICDDTGIDRSEGLKFPKIYDSLKSSIMNGSAEDIKIYMKSWYSKHKDCSWYDSHKSKEHLYYGYWSFEAAAVAKRISIDDTGFDNIQYYPYDLAHFDL